MIVLFSVEKQLFLADLDLFFFFLSKQNRAENPIFVSLVARNRKNFDLNRVLVVYMGIMLD